MKTILVIDDEQGIREVLTEILEGEGYVVITAEDGIKGLHLVQTTVVDCLLLDLWLPGKGGIAVLEEVRSAFPIIPVVIISGHGNVDLAVKALKQGAFDFLEKPLSLNRVITTVRNAVELESLRKENTTLRLHSSAHTKIIGESAVMQSIQEIVKQIADTDVQVLITGENGTGKELVARTIHEESKRHTQPFIAVNCAALPDNLIESELFGYMKGAFTSAVSDHKGRFEQADTGTLFLDEIADMSLNAQAKVLRVIETMQFSRLGSDSSIHVNVRIIAATNKNLQKMIKEKKFREDLFFRLNVIPIHVPPLRERKEDIVLLVQEFLTQQKREIRFHADAIEQMQQYKWSGNIRELKNIVERISLMSDTDEIHGETIAHFLGENSSALSPAPLQDYLMLKFTEAREKFEREYLTAKLQENDCNISRTAKALGMYSSSLHAKIQKLHIDVQRI